MELFSSKLFYIITPVLIKRYYNVTSIRILDGRSKFFSFIKQKILFISKKFENKLFLFENIFSCRFNFSAGLINGFIKDPCR
jgi:hypothetical protein